MAAGMIADAATFATWRGAHFTLLYGAALLLAVAFLLVMWQDEGW